MFHRSALFALALGLTTAGCARNDLSEPPVPLGNFVLGHNVVVADNVQKVPISRDATKAEWEAAVGKAVSDRFGRYEGSRIYNIGISVDGYALAPPGIPVVAAPKSVLVITANIWDDATKAKLNAEGKQITVFEGLSGETLIGTGITRTKQQQMAALSYNAVRKVEDWLLEHPEWFGMTPEQQAAALAQRREQLARARSTNASTAQPPAQPAPAVATTTVPAVAQNPN